MDHIVTTVMLINYWRKTLASFLFVLFISFSLLANAEDSITVNISVLDEVIPKPLVPESRTAPVKLRPPPHKKLGLTSKNRIKLQPPPSMIKRGVPAVDKKNVANQKQALPIEPASKIKETQVTETNAFTKPKTPQALETAVTEQPSKPTAITPAVTTSTVSDAMSDDSAKKIQTEPESAREKMNFSSPEDAQTASFSKPKIMLAQANEFTILYSVGETAVPKQANKNLYILANRMMKDANLRVEFIAFASDAEGSVSRSRRLSLERAVNARKVILDAGVDSSRVNLRALGEQDDDKEPDRINVIVTKR